MRPTTNCVLVSTSYTELGKSANIEYRNLLHCFCALKMLEKMDCSYRKLLRDICMFLI